MNNRRTLLATIEKAKILKNITEIRGKAFSKNIAELSQVFEEYFALQAIEWKLYVENSPLLFADNEPINKNFFDKFSKKILQFLQNAYNLGVKFLSGQLGDDFFVDDQGAKEYANTRAGDLIKGVDETTQKRLQAIIAQGLSNGWNKQQMVTEIEKEFLEFGKVRATLIAQQETAMAHEYAQEKEFRKLAEKAGVTGYKRSQTQGDDKVRHSHRVNELAGWIEETSLFPGTQTMHAPHGFRCRCVTLRRLYLPDVDEQLGIYADEVFLPHFSDKEKQNLLSSLSYISQHFPYISKFSIITEGFESDGAYNPRKHQLLINPDWINGKKSWQIGELLAHEYGHIVKKYFHDNNPKIYASILEESEKLFKKGIKEKNYDIWRYPLEIMDGKFYKNIHDKEARTNIVKEEFFAEALRLYWRGEFDALDESPKQLFSKIIHDATD